MEDFTFRPIPQDILQRVLDKAEFMIVEEIKHAGDASIKELAQKGVRDFIRIGEPIAHKRIPSPANPSHRPLGHYYDYVRAQYHVEAQRRASLHKEMIAKAPNRPENIEHVHLEAEYRAREHFAGGRLAAAAALLSMRDPTFLPDLEEELPEHLRIAQSSARNDLPQQPTPAGPLRTAASPSNRIRPTRGSSRQFQIFDKTGLIPPRP